MPDIRTAQELNQWLAACGCCPVALTPEPRIECGSVSLTLCGITPNDVGILTHPTYEERDILYATCTYSGASADTAFPRNDSETHSFIFTRSPAAVPTGASCGLGRIQGSYDATISNYHSAPYDTIIQGEETRSGTCDGIDFGSGVVLAWSGTSNEYDTGGTLISGPNATSGSPIRDFLQLATLDSAAAWSGATLTYQGFDADFSLAVSEQTVALADAYTAESAAEAFDAVSLDPEDFVGSACASTITITLAADEIRIKAAQALKVRYRIGVPTGFAGTTYEAQWDEGFFPAAWIAWDESGRVGAEPDPKPSRVAARSWSYVSAAFSDWFNLPVPSSAGETRVVNVLVAGSQTKYGRKPTSYGDTYDFDA